MNVRLVTILAKALARYAPKRYPQNIMGGCCDCSSVEKGRHNKRCRWVQAREALKAAEKEGAA